MKSSIANTKLSTYTIFVRKGSRVLKDVVEEIAKKYKCQGTRIWMRNDVLGHVYADSCTADTMNFIELMIRYRSTVMGREVTKMAIIKKEDTNIKTHEVKCAVFNMYKDVYSIPGLGTLNVYIVVEDK